MVIFVFLFSYEILKSIVFIWVKNGRVSAGTGGTSLGNVIACAHASISLTPFSYSKVITPLDTL